ncbi:hypothetical protein [Dermatophilus congolensis]|uniref:Uncharacterized protein n=1 Tax=Dermatophilus congolensis TaxID=1863 RepID=A0A239VUJ1_9MICO|nr:hypothetical protein [Dermatophilus congolensis]MBO3130021.1 histidine kinase [Dermatophilus congolensis]MBO3131349.1 histidine kinase [Dermatophilus congolensis]MBO3134495.1 histidine kinase [Dermatophilus congolensis]MBO3136730.1 histidine kinase [Dermatophilus congolensis]MBO3138975.1 histidine kinase [Dermatophilus congolensis]
MSDQTSLSAIAARLQELREQAETVETTAMMSGVRFIVATDWSEASTVLATLRAYAAVFPEEAPVELCFAVPHEPGEADEECAGILIEGLNGSVPASVSVASFEEVSKAPYDSAVVPTGDTSLLITEVGGLITRMFDISRSMPTDGSSLPSGANKGDLDALKKRLEEFSA